MPTTLDRYQPPAGATQPLESFWRTPFTNGSLPDGVTDPADSISRNGRVGIGNIGSTTAPVPMLDLANGGRTGTHTGNVPGSGAYLTAGAGGWGRNADFVPLADNAVGVLKLRHTNGTQGLTFGYNGIQHESRNAATTGQVFMLGTSHANTSIAFGWAGWNTNNVVVHERNAATHPAVGGSWVQRWQANGALYAEENVVQAAQYNRAGDRRQAYYELRLAQTGGSYGMRNALRIAPVADLGLPGARNGYQSFSHYFQPTDMYGALATIVLWQQTGVLAEGAKVSNSWAGFGTVTGPNGGTQGVVYTSGRVEGPHLFIGAASRANQLSSVPTTAAHQAILALWDDTSDRSRARFSLGLPQGGTQPGGLAQGELWVDNAGVVHCVL